MRPDLTGRQAVLDPLSWPAPNATVVGSGTSGEARRRIGEIEASYVSARTNDAPSAEEAVGLAVACRGAIPEAALAAEVLIDSERDLFKVTERLLKRRSVCGKGLSPPTSEREP
jgi:hypothetical protein